MVGCYKQRRPVSKPHLTIDNVDALIFFHIPLERWPLGAQLHLQTGSKEVLDSGAGAEAAQIMSAVRVELSSLQEARSRAPATEVVVKLQRSWQFAIGRSQAKLVAVRLPIEGSDKRVAWLQGCPVNVALATALRTAAAAEHMRFRLIDAPSGQFKVSASS